MLPASRRSRIVAIVVLALVVVASGPTRTVASAATRSANAFGPASERQVFALTNEARAAAGRPALAWDDALLSVARWRSRDMAIRGYFSHEIPPAGTKVFDVMSTQGYCFDLAGENIGWNNYPDATATADIEHAWLTSAGHRANIMGRTWDVMAVGAYTLPDGRHFWTVLFADRCQAGNAAVQPTVTLAAPGIDRAVVPPGGTGPAPAAAAADSSPAPGLARPAGVPVAPARVDAGTAATSRSVGGAATAGPAIPVALDAVAATWSTVGRGLVGWILVTLGTTRSLAR
jgi:uncharacterized protein YkwD